MFFPQLMETNLLSETIVSPLQHSIYFFSNDESRIKCEICSKLIIEAPDIVLVPLFLTLNIIDTLFRAGCNTLMPYSKFIYAFQSQI